MSNAIGLAEDRRAPRRAAGLLAIARDVWRRVKGAAHSEAEQQLDLSLLAEAVENWCPSSVYRTDPSRTDEEWDAAVLRLVHLALQAAGVPHA